MSLTPACFSSSVFRPLLSTQRSSFVGCFMERTTTMFQPDTVHEIFKLVWGQLASKAERAKDDLDDIPEGEVVAAAGTTKKIRSTSANANALKLSCELLRLFVCEAVQRMAIIAEGEGLSTIEGTHLERILPQLLLDF